MINIPLVTIVIPTYCGEKTIEESISSVLLQKLNDFELIVLDDASSDQTSEIVLGFNDSRIIYIRNKINQGPESNWNQGLSIARGKYFKLLPHDDVLHSECLLRQVGVLEEDKSERLALAFSARNVVDPDGRHIIRRGWPRKSSGIVSGSLVGRRCIRYGTNLLGEPGSVLFRLSLANKVGSFSSRFPYVTDLEYWLRLLLHGDAYYDAEPLATFRLSRESWSYSISKRQSDDFSAMANLFIDSGKVIDLNWVDRAGGKFMPGINARVRRLIYALL